MISVIWGQVLSWFYDWFFALRRVLLKNCVQIHFQEDICLVLNCREKSVETRKKSADLHFIWKTSRCRFYDFIWAQQQCSHFLLKQASAVRKLHFYSRESYKNIFQWNTDFPLFGACDIKITFSLPSWMYFNNRSLKIYEESLQRWVELNKFPDIRNWLRTKNAVGTKCYRHERKKYHLMGWESGNSTFVGEFWLQWAVLYNWVLLETFIQFEMKKFIVFSLSYEILM